MSRVSNHSLLVDLTHSGKIECYSKCLSSLIKSGMMGVDSAVQQCEPPPISQALCGFIAATNIELYYPKWSCTPDGFTVTDPCANKWTGIGCNDGTISNIGLYSSNITGTCKTLRSHRCMYLVYCWCCRHTSLLFGRFIRYIKVQPIVFAVFVFSRYFLLTRINTRNGLHDCLKSDIGSTIPSEWSKLTNVRYFTLYNLGLVGKCIECCYWWYLPMIIILTCMFAGNISKDFCNLNAYSIDLRYNDGISCFPLCWNQRYVTYNLQISQPFNDCTPSAEKVLCGFIETTNIGSVYSEWQCTEEGRTASDACAKSWHGVQCVNGSMVGLQLENNQITGLLLCISLCFVQFLILLWLQERCPSPFCLSLHSARSSRLSCAIWIFLVCLDFILH